MAQEPASGPPQSSQSSLIQHKDDAVKGPREESEEQLQQQRLDYMKGDNLKYE